MSDQVGENANADSPVEKMRGAAELEPIIAGVESIAKTVNKRTKEMDEKTAVVDKKVDRLGEDLEGKMNKGFEDVLDRIERSNKMHSSAILGALHIEPSGDNLQELVGERYKGRGLEFEMAAKNLGAVVGEKSPLANPTTHMLVQEWFENETKAGLSRKYKGKVAQFSERAEKICRALDETYMGEAGFKAKAALQEDTAAEGGNWVPTIVETDVHRLIKDAGDIFPRARQVALRKKTTSFPSESTAFTVGWAEEEATLSGTEGNLAKVDLVAEKIYGRATMSIELIEDAAPGLLQYLLEVYTELMAGELDAKAVLGTGSSPQITGIINGSGINAITASTQRALTWALITKTFAEAAEQSTRMDGVWICSKNGYAQIIGLVDSEGRPIVQWNTNEPANAPAGTVLGRPIIVSGRVGGSATLDDSTNTKTKILFGPLRYFLAGTRMGMRWDVTDQVNWAKFQVDARLVGRFGGNVSVPSAFTYLGDISY